MAYTGLGNKKVDQKYIIEENVCNVIQNYSTIDTCFKLMVGLLHSMFKV